MKKNYTENTKQRSTQTDTLKIRNTRPNKPIQASIRGAL